ncbi:MAG: 3-dehydroquinate synthase II [Candidatus Lokiarchaeota archaeon]|nr:3-dehydroquinate synthase II [Candidatus Lokiarchaeota archaeon]
MKKIILNFERKTSDFKELVQEAFNKNFLNFLVSAETYSEFEEIERINLYSKDMELASEYKIYEENDKLTNALSTKKKEESLGYYKELNEKEDEKEIVKLSEAGGLDFIIVTAKNWKIIPFENLIAEMHEHNTDLIAEVENIQEAELMLKTLEIGVDGILLTPHSTNDLIDIKNLIHKKFKIELTNAKITSIDHIPESERVCVDTTSLFSPGEGLLVGSTAMGFVLVHAEVFETQFVASRPFRVNAGDVSAYVLVPNENSEKIYRTNYLSELKGGKKVLAVTKDGNARIVSVGRVKIETRPMLRFELEARKADKKISINCICQNAETIRLVKANGEAISVVDIKEGDELLVHVGPGATHFGTAIKETIIEK